MIGNFLNIFKRDMWDENIKCLDKNLIADKRTWSNFDNTLWSLKFMQMHLKILKLIFVPKDYQLIAMALESGATYILSLK